ncbi:hypothetical protein SASPL_147103 [Salvia splendens]|uniref:Uncharacterized protein n=1 Tax=Salvia splendens TaxID=180675 RepID=A0A8X8WDU8_SALSN|nr:hypothetical protein SASPL_147103 [Salvia splendens]
MQTNCITLSLFHFQRRSSPATNLNPFLRRALDRLAGLLRLLPNIHRPLLHAPLRIVQRLLPGRLPERVEHPRDRREAGQPKRPGREERGHGPGQQDDGRHQDGAEDDEDRGGNGEPDEAANERDPGKAEESAADGEERYHGEDLAGGGALAREEGGFSGGVVAVEEGLLLGVDLDLVWLWAVAVGHDEMNGCGEKVGLEV